MTNKTQANFGIRSATARAPVNIALVKHWGYAPDGSERPARPSLSVTLSHESHTSVTLRPAGKDTQDEILLNGAPLAPVSGEKAGAAYAFLAKVRRAAGLVGHVAHVEASVDIPVSAGFASSAAGGAALTLAALRAAALPESEEARLRWCRSLRSISALRSLRGGIVWLREEGDTLRLDTVETALDLTVLSCLVEPEAKTVSSTLGHGLAHTSPEFEAFVAAASSTIHDLIDALGKGDFTAVGQLAEADALAMHQVMRTSQPRVNYATEATWEIWRQVASWRRGGMPSFCTLDAGANPHVICETALADALAARLAALPAVKRLWRSPVATLGARILESPDASN